MFTPNDWPRSLFSYLDWLDALFWVKQQRQNCCPQRCLLQRTAVTLVKSNKPWASLPPPLKWAHIYGPWMGSWALNRWIVRQKILLWDIWEEVKGMHTAGGIQNQECRQGRVGGTGGGRGVLLTEEVQNLWYENPSNISTLGFLWWFIFCFSSNTFRD